MARLCSSTLMAVILLAGLTTAAEVAVSTRAAAQSGPETPPATALDPEAARAALIEGRYRAFLAEELLTAGAPFRALDALGVDTLDAATLATTTRDPRIAEALARALAAARVATPPEASFTPVAGRFVDVALSADGLTAFALRADGALVAHVVRGAPHAAWRDGVRVEGLSLDGGAGAAAMEPRGLAISRDGERLALVGDAGAVAIFDADAAAAPRLLARLDVSAVVGPLRAAAFSPDARRLIVGGEDGRAALVSLDGAPPIVLRTEPVGPAPVRSVAYAPDGAVVALGSADGLLRLYVAETGAPISVEAPHYGGVQAVAFLGGGARLATLAASGESVIWNVADLRRLSAATQDRAAALAVDGAGTVLAALSADGALRVRDADGDLVAEASAFSGRDGAAPPILAISSDAARAATLGEDGVLRVWRLASLARQSASGGPRRGGALASVSASLDGRLLVAGSDDGRVVVWERESGVRIWTHTRRGASFRSAVFSPDGALVAAAGTDGVIVVLRASDGALERAYRAHQGVAHTVAFSPDGRLLASASYDDTVRLIDPRSGRLIDVIGGGGRNAADMTFVVETGPAYQGPVAEPAPNPADGRAAGRRGVDAGQGGSAREGGSGGEGGASETEPRDLVIGDGDGEVVVDLLPPRAEGSERPQSGDLEPQISEEGAAQGEASEGQALREGAGGSAEAAEPPPAIIGGAARSGSGAAPTGAETTEAPRAPRAQPQAPGEGDQAGAPPPDAAAERAALGHGFGNDINGVAFSADGLRLVTAGDDNAAHVWSLGSDGGAPRHLAALEGHSGLVWDAVFSPDGRLVATGSADGRVRLFDASTGAMLRALEGHRDGITRVRFSPDGRLLASASFDGSARLWDVATGAPGRVAELQGGPVYGVTFVEDGAALALALGDGRVGRVVLRSDPATTLDAARALLEDLRADGYVVGLSREERCAALLAPAAACR